MFQRVCLPDNSLFVLGWESNRQLTHEIKRDKRPLPTKREDERAYGGHRISLTFRHVATYYRRGSDHRVFGQGAPHKTEAELDAALAAGDDVPAAAAALAVESDRTGEDAAADGADATREPATAEEEDCLKMLHAFSAENRDPTFDWEENYGKGFSSINMRTMNPH